MVYIVMGVCGCGKSTVGKQLATALKGKFFDGDDFHPTSNVEKMSNGIPLDDQDRADWFASLNRLIEKHREQPTPTILACSALKEKYRQTLNPSQSPHIQFIHLHGSMELIQHRMNARQDHFMPPSLLQSQFDDLEPPSNAISINIDQTVEAQITQIMQAIESSGTAT